MRDDQKYYDDKALDNIKIARQSLLEAEQAITEGKAKLAMHKLSWASRNCIDAGDWLNDWRGESYD